LKKYLEEVKFIKHDNFEIYKQNREKILYSNFKMDNKTRFSNPVLNDNLTPTIHAFYYCEKSRQILSDNEAAALKVMNLDNKYEIIDKECLNADCNSNLNKGVIKKEFDQVNGLINLFFRNLLFLTATRTIISHLITVSWKKEN
jgi:hypothetical protein